MALKAAIAAVVVLCAATVTVYSFRAETIDASSIESMEASVNAVTSSLSPEDKQRFQQALSKIALSAAFATAFASPGTVDNMTPADALALIRPRIHGKTAEEIIAAGWKKPSPVQADPEPDPRSAEKEAQKSCLAKTVSIQRVKIERRKYTSGWRMLLDVTNQMTWPVSSVRISYAVRSEDRQVPWDDGDQFMRISGGINPGETRQVGVDLRYTPKDISIDTLRVKAVVTDVVDADNRQLVREVNLMDADNEISTQSCIRRADQ